MTLTDERAFSISRCAYELYKENWLNENTDAEERMQNVRDYAAYVQVCLEKDWKFDEFDEYMTKCAAVGEKNFYMPYEVFLDSKYLDEGYISALLKEDGLVTLYEEDLHCAYFAEFDL